MVPIKSEFRKDISKLRLKASLNLIEPLLVISNDVLLSSITSLELNSNPNGYCN